MHKEFIIICLQFYLSLLCVHFVHRVVINTHYADKNSLDMPLTVVVFIPNLDIVKNKGACLINEKSVKVYLTFSKL